MATLLEEFQKTWLISLIGIGLVVGGIYTLTWNEGRAVHHAHSLDEAYRNAIALNPYEPPLMEYDGRVVHISGPVLVQEPLTEPDYGISVQAVKLKRRVQMYQWVEERTPRSDYIQADSIAAESSDSDYYYVTEWRDKLVDSSNFYIRHGHQNPPEIPLKTKIYTATVAKCGQLNLGEEIKSQFNNWIEITSDERPETRDIKLHMGIYYHCDDVWNPEVGDIRVQFYYAGVSGEEVTVIAKQQKDSLVPYRTLKGHDLSFLRHGTFNINQMFDYEHSDAKLELWKFRGTGIFMLYAASVCLARILKIALGQVPMVRNLISNGDHGSFLFSISISLIIIATAWMYHRPLLGIGLVFAALSPFFYCTMEIYNVAQNYGVR